LPTWLRLIDLPDGIAHVTGIARFCSTAI
jgi:hypothetical protein